MMKRTMLAAVLAFAGLAVYAADKPAKMSLADASGRIAEAIDKPDAMQDIVSKLSAEDQVAFLSKVNSAIDDLKGSPDSKIAKYLDANMAALKASASGNLSKMLAETFATVPPEALVVINEEFAAKLFNRAADPEHVFTDDAFTNLVFKAMDVVQKRNETADDAGVRNTFAILMFVRASNGTPADLVDVLVDRLSDATTRELAKSEWLGPALNEKNYEPLLAAADAGAQPEIALIIRLAKPQLPFAMLSDLASGGMGGNMYSGQVLSISGGTSLNLSDLDNTSGLNRIPRSSNPADPWYGGATRNEEGGEAVLYPGQDNRL